LKFHRPAPTVTNAGFTRAKGAGPENLDGFALPAGNSGIGNRHLFRTLAIYPGGIGFSIRKPVMFRIHA